MLSESVPLGIQQCPSNAADMDYNDGDERHCYLANWGTTVIICSSDVDGEVAEYNGTACEEIFSPYTYTDLGNNRLKRESVGGRYYHAEAWTGYIDVYSRGIEYGCKTNYYSFNGKYDESIICEQCPNGGESKYFNVAKTNCCIPRGTYFSDIPGSGTYTADCCWKE